MVLGASSSTRHSLSSSKNALQDGKFLVDFYMLHPSDKRCNATNQRYWLEYHPTTESFGPLHQSTAHLLRPSSEEALYASANGLKPFRQWVRLLNNDTYIHGPFNFSTLNGRVTKDRISESDWSILHKYEHLYSNQVPPMNLPRCTVHLSQFHTTSDDQDLAARFAACFATPSSFSIIQSVLSLTNPPKIFFFFYKKETLLSIRTPLVPECSEKPSVATNGNSHFWRHSAKRIAERT